MYIMIRLKLLLLNIIYHFYCLFIRRRSYPARNEKDKEKPIRFAVRSLGWVDISEIDLTPERSSKAVNRCIVELSFGKNGLIDNVGRWGDVCFILKWEV